MTKITLCNVKRLQVTSIIYLKNTIIKKHIVVKVVSDQHLQLTTRCHHGDGCRIDSKPRINIAHLLQLFHCFTKPRSAQH